VAVKIYKGDKSPLDEVGEGDIQRGPNRVQKPQGVVCDGRRHPPPKRVSLPQAVPQVVPLNVGHPPPRFVGAAPHPAPVPTPGAGASRHKGAAVQGGLLGPGSAGRGPRGPAAEGGGPRRQAGEGVPIKPDEGPIGV
jgi:hypothetical protein